MSSTDSEHHATGDHPTDQPSAVTRPLDLDLIETDLADVDIALARLDRGDYWRDEVTGEPLDDALLARRPTARRAESHPATADTSPTE